MDASVDQHRQRPEPTPDKEAVNQVDDEQAEQVTTDDRDELPELNALEADIARRMGFGWIVGPVS